jgi:hypothetical protein
MTEDPIKKTLNDLDTKVCLRSNRSILKQELV